jgi:hypothetical protein
LDCPGLEDCWSIRLRVRKQRRATYETFQVVTVASMKVVIVTWEISKEYLILDMGADICNFQIIVTYKGTVISVLRF